MAGGSVQSDGIPVSVSQTAQVVTALTASGVPGATAGARFAGGTATGAPATGTFAAGDYVIDQTGKVQVCTTAGSPGTWVTAGGAQPWQFFIDNYAKGDGQQALVNTVAGSAVINTTPLGAPGSAPSLSNSGSGGTIPAGVYQVKVTYVNRWGETTASASASTTTSGSTSTITISSPAALGGTIGWYAYVTAAGGSTFFRQQPAGSPTVVQDELVLTAPPGTSGANPPGSDTSAAQVFTSTAVDGGKNIMICGGLGTPGGPWIDTIATVQSPTQATLSTNGGSQGGNVTQAGCAMVFSSDDRLAIDQCVQAAEAYLATPGNNLVQVIAGSKIYGLGTGFFQSTNAQGTAIGGYGVSYNTQLRMPFAARLISGQDSKAEGHLLGPGDSAHNQYWVSQAPNLLGACFVSYSLGPSTADATYGQQSVIGAPAPGSHLGNNGFANYKAIVDGIQVVQPGWSNSIGLDLGFIGGCRARGMSMAFAPSTNVGGGVNPSNGWQTNSFWLNKIGAGLRTPGEGNNDDVIVDSWATSGLNNGILNQADHLVINRLSTIGCDSGIFITGADSNCHDLTINQWSVEACNGGIKTPGGSGHITCHIVMDGENASMTDVNDAGNMLYGVLYWSDGFRSGGQPTVTGAANLRIINCTMTRTVQAAPSYTLGTAFQNPWWNPMWVQLSGGTVTNVQIGPTSATCTTSVATSTPTTLRLPSGWWLNITGTVKPTTFNAVPD